MRKGTRFCPLSAGNQNQAENGHPAPKMRYYQNRPEMKSKQILEVLSCLGSKESVFKEKKNFRHFRLKIRYLTATAEIGKKRLSQQYKMVRKYVLQKCSKFTEFFFSKKQS